MSALLPRFCRLVVLPLAAAAVLMTAGCSREQDQAQPASGGGGSHTHAAPHGGTLVELGDHACSIEFLLDRRTGTLTAFVLDGHAQHAVRVAAPSLQVVIEQAGRYEAVILEAVANALSNETVGNTSEFSGQAPWLQTSEQLHGKLVELTALGETYRNVNFTLF